MKRAHIQKVKFIAVLTILSLHGLSCTWALSIHRAAMNGRVDQITKRMEKGDKVNAYDNYGWTPLMWAVYYNQLNAVRYLISQGADVNYASKDRKSGV